MVFSTSSTSAFAAAAAAALVLFSSSTGVSAGELDVPGYNLMPKAQSASQHQDQQQYKRAPSRTYGLLKNWQGDDFLNNWDYFSWADPTHGMVNYQDRWSAQNKGLAYRTDSGSFVMKVDNNNWLGEGSYRDSVRITSQEKFSYGNLLIYDAAHMPIGCGTWPAFWTVGTDWPYNGEIDIIENVNNKKNNQMTLHTRPGCDISQSNKGAGNVLHTTCDAFYNDNVGCGVNDPSTKSYGDGFNSAGGGVFATLWNEDGISIWFFSRNNIPSDISSQSPNPSKWGKPRAIFSTDDCSIRDFFGDQTIVINTTLCGDWAGGAYQAHGCPGTCSQRVTNPSNFDQAYWEINYVRLYAPLSLSRGGRNTAREL